MLTIQKETWQQGLLLSHGASWMQANLYVINHGDQKIVIKDFSGAPALVRCTFCRFILRREIIALEKLKSLSITPRYLGKVGDYAYAMEYIEGENFKFSKHVKNIDFLIAMRDAVNSMHDAGVVHNDLHGKNIIVSTNGQLYFIDFASAFFRSQHDGLLGKIKNKVFDFFVLGDDSKISLLIKRYDPSSLTLTDNKMLTIKKFISCMTRVWKKFINEPFLRKRTWHKRKEYLKKLMGY